MDIATTSFYAKLRFFFDDHYLMIPQNARWFQASTIYLTRLWSKWHHLEESKTFGRLQVLYIMHDGSTPGQNESAFVRYQFLSIMLY